MSQCHGLFLPNFYFYYVSRISTEKSCLTETAVARKRKRSTRALVAKFSSRHGLKATLQEEHGGDGHKMVSQAFASGEASMMMADEKKKKEHTGTGAKI